MNTDIRIAVSFINHRKRKKLKMLLGPGSTDYLIDLWINTAINHPKGVLLDMDKTDIALEAGWEGDPQQFVDALVAAGFLDVCSPHAGSIADLQNDPEKSTLKNFNVVNYSLHDWQDHQPYAFFSEERASQASNAAKARWEKRRANSQSNAGSIKGAIKEQCSPNAERYAPSPSPSPKERKKNKERKKSADFVFELPKDINPETWDRFVEMRKSIKKPLTEYAKYLICLDLEKIGQNKEAVLNQSIKKSWQGVFALKEGETGSLSETVKPEKEETRYSQNRDGSWTNLRTGETMPGLPKNEEDPEDIQGVNDMVKNLASMKGVN